MDRYMSQEEEPEGTPSSPEPTIEEWHELLDIVLANVTCEVERTVGFLMRTTPGGRAYLAHVKDVRPELEIGEGLSLIAITDTYEASRVVDRLLDNPRYGIDRDLYIRDFALTDEWVTEPPEGYPVVIELLRVKEERARTEEERDRLREVRAAVERELMCEDVKAYLQKDERKEE